MTKGERDQIKLILQDSKWQTVERLANVLCDKISYDSVVRSSEWDTISTALTNEGQVRGIKRFIQELYAEATKEDQT